MYGRDDAGHSSTIATHHPPASTIEPNATTRGTTRRASGMPAQRRYASASAGSTRNACSILVRNARPTSAPPSASQRVPGRPVAETSTARVVAYAAATISNTSSASGLLNRNISVATGVSASTAPASSPAAPEPVVRRTVACSSATAATPSSACGTRIAHDDRPNSRTESAIGQRLSGVLSTVIAFAASNEPKKNAFHDSDPAWAAAA